MREYVVIFERGPSNWSAYLPDLPGCVAAAKTRAETESLIREAVALHLETMHEDGEPIPEPTSEASVIAVAS